MIIYWSNRAEKNYDDILNYLKANWQPNVSTKFVEDFRRVIEIIEKIPRIFLKYEDDENTIKVVINPYVLLFYKIVSDEEIELICLWNSGRNPDDLPF